MVAGQGRDRADGWIAWLFQNPRLDSAQLEWPDKEVFPDPPEGHRRVLDLVAKLPTREPVLAAAG
jgi:hypothetical protein